MKQLCAQHNNPSKILQLLYLTILPADNPDLILLFLKYSVFYLKIKTCGGPKLK